LRNAVARLRARADAALPRGLHARMATRLRQAMLAPRVRPGDWWLACLAATLLAAAGALLVARGLGFAAAWPVVLASCFGFVLPWLWLQERCAQVRHAVVRALPGFLDLVVLGLEAGCGLASAIQEAATRTAPGPLRRAFDDALRRIRAGQDRSDALAQLAAQLDVMTLATVIGAIRQAETTGIALAPLIRSQAQRCLRERFALAERKAMEAPVRMLLPLVLCIFPCTFIVIGFPLAVDLYFGVFR
jgi:tight adherence protein C